MPKMPNRLPILTDDHLSMPVGAVSPSRHTVPMIDSWLLRTPQGWAEPTPPDCVCGSDRYLIGWQACQCGAGPFTGGHRTWECRACGARTLVGCVGRVGAGPMEEYGVRIGKRA